MVDLLVAAGKLIPRGDRQQKGALTTGWSSANPQKVCTFLLRCEGGSREVFDFVNQVVRVRVQVCTVGAQMVLKLIIADHVPFPVELFTCELSLIDPTLHALRRDLEFLSGIIDG